MKRSNRSLNCSELELNVQQLYETIYGNDQSLLFNFTTFMLNFFPILFLMVGTIGNTLSFIILTSKKMRKTSTFCYLACLSLVDFAVIYTFSVNFILNQYFNIDIQIKSITLCRIFAFLVYFLPQYSAWILVLVSVDRVFKIIMCSGKLIWSMNPLRFNLFKNCHCNKIINRTDRLNASNPEKSKTNNKVHQLSKKRSFKHNLIKKWNTPKGSIISVSITGVILFIINIHFFVFQIHQYSGVEKINEFEKKLNLMDGEVRIKTFISNYIRNESEFKFRNIRDYYLRKRYEVNPIICSPEHSKRYWTFYRNYWVHIDTLINVFIPSTIMFISCLIICFTIRKSIIKFRRRSRLVYFNVLEIHQNQSKNKPENVLNRKKNEKNCKLPSKQIDCTSTISNTMSPNLSHSFNSIIKVKSATFKPKNNRENLKSDISIKRYSSVPTNIHLKFQEFKIKSRNNKSNYKKLCLFKKCITCNSKFTLQKSNNKKLLKKPDKIYILIILVAINFLFIILTAPIVLFLSLQAKSIHEIEDVKDKARLRLVKVICLFLMNANHVVNILIYGIKILCLD